MPPARTSPTPKDSRAARAARRDRVVLAEIELWRSVAGQMATPSRRSSGGSTTEGSVVDENGSVAGTEEDAEDETRSTADDGSSAKRGIASVAESYSVLWGFDLSSPSTVTPEIQSLELQVNHMALVESPTPNPQPPSTPRRRSRLRL
ncbi:hypothetical protein RhiXN_02311 [Rhizoctonia solani]|uniref:Uncharacterized protein n=1 Tax=Rhizoctonia solani TaxID=456999 RepID=A0A8H8T2P4_9AGAM|nr:uncharacterized protein RhiXN_02311 [Rhizoctonia solani]QRW27716.1 hypothetical protein RhiXN_02311 [Rhizoctonia solani]